MSAETFVFTQLQSGALPTELSEVFCRTCLHYLTLINEMSEVARRFPRGGRGFSKVEGFVITRDIGAENLPPKSPSSPSFEGSRLCRVRRGSQTEE